MRERYAPAMTITDEAEAEAFLDSLASTTLKLYQPMGLGLFEAVRIERVMLGYVAGYEDHETRARVERLFKCEHPFLGSIERDGPPSAMGALLVGMLFAELLKLERPPRPQ